MFLSILPIEYGVPLGSVLGPILFLMYINGLNNAVEFSVHHFADDTNVLYSRKYVEDINRKNNFDLKNIVMWIRANKILLNADKTKLVQFRSKKQKNH